MRYLLCKRSLGTAILVALAAGTLHVPAANAQSTTPKKTSNSSSTARSSTARNSSTAKHTSSSASRSASARKTSSRKRSKRQKGQAAPTPDRISEIQQALAKNGSYSGEPSGKLDGPTLDSIKKFQTSNGLRVTGKLDAPTLQKLGLGSETAGLGVPTPPPNAISNRLLSRSVQRDELKNEDQPQ